MTSIYIMLIPVRGTTRLCLFATSTGSRTWPAVNHMHGASCNRSLIVGHPTGSYTSQSNYQHDTTHNPKTFIAFSSSSSSSSPSVLVVILDIVQFRLFCLLLLFLLLLPLPFFFVLPLSAKLRRILATMGIDFRDGHYRRYVRIGKRTIKEGEAAAIWSRNGRQREVIGPSLERLFYSHIRFLSRYMADPSQVGI